MGILKQKEKQAKKEKPIKQKKKKASPWTKEFQTVWKQEQKFLKQYEHRSEGTLDRTLEAVSPEKMMNAIHTGFVKAFGVVFEKGDGIIAKAGKQDARHQEYQVNRFAVELQENKKRLQAFTKAANKAGRSSVMLSGAAGVGMGIFGVALPDVPLFTTMLLKCVYETGESFGYGHDTEEERLYVLRVIEGALSYGETLRRRSQALDTYAQTRTWQGAVSLEQQVEYTARQLSEAVIYGKLLQNIPVAGAVGGANNAVIMERVRRYALIRYWKRFLISRRMAEEAIPQ